MGHTHSWTLSSRPDDTAWGRLMQDAKLLIRSFPAKVAYEFDAPHRPAEVTWDQIRFNGVGDAGAEPFILKREPTILSDFCKTYRRRYDRLVLAVLACAANRFDIRIQSEAERHDWTLAAQWARKVVGHAVPIPRSLTTAG